MTINTTNNRVEYAGNGVTTVFSFPNRFLADADLVVLERNDTTGVETIKTLTTHYTVSGAGDAAGGSVTMVTAPATGVSLVIYRDPALTQTVDLVNNDPLPVETAVEQPLDKLTMIGQRDRELLERSLRLPDGDTGFTADDMKLPPEVTRASKFLAFDADGKPIASAGQTDPGLRADLASTADTVLGDALIGGKRSDTGALAFTLHAFNQNRVLNVKTDFGAVGDGVTDDTAALQAALTVGGAIYIPPGVYKVTSTLTLATNAWIVGAGRTETILRQATNFTLMHLSDVDGFGLARFQIHNSQASASVTSGVGIFLENSAAGVMDDLYINNTYIGVHIQASPILRCNAVDVQYFKNCGWLLDGGGNYDVYVKNSIADGQLEMAPNGLYSVKLYDHCDEIVFDTCVLNMASYPLHISAVSSAPGVRPAFCRFRNCSFDSCTNGAEVDRAVDTVFEGCFFSSRNAVTGNGCVVGATDAEGTTFIGCMFANSGANGLILQANSKHTKVIGCNIVANSLFEANTYHGINVAAGTMDFSIIGCTITNGWGFSGQQGWGIAIGAGAVTRYQLVNNNVTGNGLGGISDGSTGTERYARDNIGFVTRTKGEGTIASGTTSLVVNHGLSVTPVGYDISIEFLTSSTNDPGNWWITAVGATQFTVNVRNDPGASGLTFAWVAEVLVP